MATTEPNDRTASAGRYQFTLTSLLVVMTGGSVAMASVSIHAEFGPAVAVAIFFGSLAAGAVMTRHRHVAYFTAALAMGSVYYLALRTPIVPLSSAFIHSLSRVSSTPSYPFLVPYVSMVATSVIVFAMLHRWIRSRDAAPAVGQAIVVNGLGGGMFLLLVCVFTPDGPYEHIITQGSWGLLAKVIAVPLFTLVAFMVGVLGAMLCLYISIPLSIVTIMLLRWLDPRAADLTDSDWLLLRTVQRLRAEGKATADQLATRFHMSPGELQRRLDRLAKIGAIDVDLDGFRCCLPIERQKDFAPIGATSNAEPEAAAGSQS